MALQQTAASNITPPSNLYTVILGVAFAMTFATLCYVVYMCYVQYGAILPPQ
ncbi:MAG: hypothetical protein WC374_02665 [Phycisphaerae bacterium]|jgi:hypothetical protein